jgi:hypothetical protein
MNMRNNGLSIVLLGLFLACWAGQAVAGHAEYNSDQSEHRQPTLTLSDYLATSHFWEATLENWESEFLQMAAFVLLTTVLYQRGSAESKRVGVREPVDIDARPERVTRVEARVCGQLGNGPLARFLDRLSNSGPAVRLLVKEKS